MNNLSDKISHQIGSDDLRNIICKIKNYLLENNDKAKNYEAIFFLRKQRNKRLRPVHKKCLVRG
ncbi:MAG: hypothetical protein HWE19_02530 [Vibrionaceae bacterium]|nr:hypothetical protein [Vibrionaceae bacterium]